MTNGDGRVTFDKKELRGSRLRCLILTSGSREQVAHRLTRLVEPHAEVDAQRDGWTPGGFLEPQESTLEENDKLLPPGMCRELTNWWLAKPRRATKPTWDIGSTAMIGGRKGIILVEAKVHSTEPSDSGKTPGNKENEGSIREAMRQANAGLGGKKAGWNLTADSHYQLCNRFAWSWKIASLGIPVILVYLGFLNAMEMTDRGKPFPSATEWLDVIKSHAERIVPNDAWNRPIDINGTKIKAIIQSVDPYNESHYVPRN